MGWRYIGIPAGPWGYAPEALDRLAGSIQQIVVDANLYSGSQKYFSPPHSIGEEGGPPSLIMPRRVARTSETTPSGAAVRPSCFRGESPPQWNVTWQELGGGHGFSALATIMADRGGERGSTL